MLSSVVASPFLPSSKNCCAADPPIAVRLPVTCNPELVGFAPGVTVTVSRTTLPPATGFGLAAPMPVGFVVAPQGAMVEAVLRGFAGPAAKSMELLSVSAQPAPARTAAVVALIVGVGPEPSKQFVPLP